MQSQDLRSNARLCWDGHSRVQIARLKHVDPGASAPDARLSMGVFANSTELRDKAAA